MNRKAWKVGLVVGAALIASLAAGVGFASSRSKGTLPEYVGSQTCLGCHADKFTAWSDSSHSVSMTELVNPADYPADPSTAPAELKAELEKADYVWHGRRFLVKDGATGELKYLNVGWNQDKKVYEPYKGGSVWSQNCGGCHSGTVNEGIVATATEPGIGCEACHGPGRDHVLGKGDVSKIVATTDSSTVCAQCHSGFNQITNSTRWAKGYRPGMKLEEFAGFQMVSYDPAQGAPWMKEDHHLAQYPQWKVSAHANAAKELATNDHASGNCYACHSTAAQQEKIAGKTPDPKTHNYSDAVGCTACHDPHGSSNVAQLRMEPKAMCESCHTAGLAPGAKLKAGAEVHHPNKEMLAGVGSPTIKDTKSFHSDLSCAECHMTEGNHEMKVITPDQVAGTARLDSCTTCHTDSEPETRGAYLNSWQETTEARLTAIATDKAIIEAALKANPKALSADLKAKYDAAKTNASFVEADGSKGAHNFEYTMKLLTTAQKDMAAARATLPQ